MQYRTSRTIFSPRLHLITLLRETYWAAAQGLETETVPALYPRVGVLEMGNGPDSLSPTYQK